MAMVQLSRGFGMNFDIHSAILPMDTVFIHGNLASNTWWEPSIEIWNQTKKPNYEGRAILGEWRGCGKSDAPNSESDLHPATIADDYIEALQKLGVKKACLIGHSTGGLIALFALMKAPELFDRALLLDPVSAKGVQFDNSMYDAFTQMSQDREFCSAVMNGTIHGNDPSHPRFQRLVDEAQLATRQLGHGVLNSLKDIDITDKLASVQHPVLVLHGEHDGVLPMEGSVELAKGLPNARFMELKDQGHSTNLENPALFVKLTDDFLFNRP